MNINTQAPVVVRQKVTINASVSEVWAVLADVDHWHRWVREINDTELVGEFAEGTGFRWQANGVKLASLIRNVEPEKKLLWTDSSMGIHTIHRWDLRQNGERTEVTGSESLEGWLVRLMRKRMEAKTREFLQSWLGQLKRAAESGAYS